MARLFGALANAGAQVNTNRFKRQQYDDQQAAQAREEARRVLEFKAMRDLAAARAEDARKQRELDTTLRAYDDGFEDAPDMTKLRGAGIAMDAVTGFRGGATEYTPPEETPYETEVEGRPVRAAKMGSQYLTVGGKVLRNNRQRGANAVAQQEEAKALWDLKMKREVAGQLAADRDQRRLELEALRNAGRLDVAQLSAALKGSQAQQPQPASEKLTGDLATLKDIADQAEYAMSLVQKTRGTAGPVAAGGRLVRKLTLQSPTSGDMAAAEYQRVTADLRKKLFGAAQSVRELRSASEFLPMLESSNDEFVSNALRGIGTAARKAAQNRIAATQAGGRGVGELGGYADQFPAFDAPQVKAPVRPDATVRPKGSPTPNRTPVPWETKK